MPARTIRSFFVAALALVALVPSRAEAQSYANEVWKQLETVYEKMAEKKYDSRNYIIGKMRDDATDTWTLTFEKGRSYQIMGVCDSDCSDLDITLFDGETKLEEDLLDDDVPIVSFEPKRTMQVSIRVSMAACSDSPCYFGIGIFVK